ncbi:signal peptidase I [Paenibacillus solisilvae]|uniref:Signal peptidase I n=1 Tax=Paenibacillus solisilvae TaxID=2486751 RepID=A0ABW0VW33_9BACL
MNLYSDSSHDTEPTTIGPRKRSHAQAAVKPPKEKPGKAGKQGSNKPPWITEVWDWSRTLSIAVIVVLLFHYFVFNLSTVKGQSMEPTLYEKEWLFINKYTYKFGGSPERSDIIILKDPSEGVGKKEYLVKRVVGIPGDTIEIRQGQLYRNGQLVVESYTDTEIEDLDYGPLKLDDDRYFVMGDNRHARASKDSRIFGPVSKDMIRGRADFILWPIIKLNSL